MSKFPARKQTSEPYGTKQHAERQCTGFKSTRNPAPEEGGIKQHIWQHCLGLTKLGRGRESVPPVLLEATVSNSAIPTRRLNALGTHLGSASKRRAERRQSGEARRHPTPKRRLPNALPERRPNGAKEGGARERTPPSIRRHERRHERHRGRPSSDAPPRARAEPRAAPNAAPDARAALSRRPSGARAALERSPNAAQAARQRRRPGEARAPREPHRLPH